jgi:hypothetical protein
MTVAMEPVVTIQVNLAALLFRASPFFSFLTKIAFAQCRRACFR